MPQVTIAGTPFEVRHPFAVGHALNEAEASVLNQTYTENVRNNMAGKIKAAKEKAEADGKTFSLDDPYTTEDDGTVLTLRQFIDNYATTYEFGVRSARTAEPVDPVEREARSIAREILNGKLRAGNIKRKDVSDEAYESALATLASGDKIVTEAKRRVKTREGIGADELDLGALVAAKPAEGADAVAAG